MQPEPFCNRFQYKKEEKSPNNSITPEPQWAALSIDREALDQHVDFVDCPSLCIKTETMPHVCADPHQHFWHNVFSPYSPGLWGKDYSIQLTAGKVRLRCKNMLGPMGSSSGEAQVRPLDQSLEVSPRAVTLGTSKGTHRVQILITAILYRNEWIYSFSKGLSVCHGPGPVWALRIWTEVESLPRGVYILEKAVMRKWKAGPFRSYDAMEAEYSRWGWGLIGSWLWSNISQF